MSVLRPFQYQSRQCAGEVPDGAAWTVRQWHVKTQVTQTFFTRLLQVAGIEHVTFINLRTIFKINLGIFTWNEASSKTNSC